MVIRNVIALNGELAPVIMLHGFPAEPVIFPDTEKNIDIAKRINERGHQVYLLHYEGLGKNRDGIFTFQSSFEEAQVLANEVYNRHGKVIVFGHSWGGYLSMLLNITIPNKIKATITLSPFCFLPEYNALLEIVTSLTNKVPYILKGGQTTEILTRNLINLDQTMFSDKINQINLYNNFVILHSLNDDEVPIESSRKIKETNQRIELIECNTDHVFSHNRELHILKILEVLSAKNR